MPLFLIERNFADELEEDPEIAAYLNRVNEDVGVRWLLSFLSADRKKTFCVYEAQNADLIREAAKQAGIPADAIIEIGEEIDPSGAFTKLDPSKYQSDA